MPRKTYRVNGMTCGGCARAVETAIKAKAPAAIVSVELDAGRVTVDGVAEADIRQAVDDAGFEFGGVI